MISEPLVVFATVFLASLLVAAGSCIASEGDATQRVAGCDEPQWTSFRQSLEKGLSSGFLSPIESIDGGRLLATASFYLEARASKDVERILDLVAEADRKAVQSFYDQELPGEALLSHWAVAAKPLEGTTDDYQVFAVVIVEVSGRCYEDVLTTHWRRTVDGWKLLPSSGVQPV